MAKQKGSFRNLLVLVELTGGSSKQIALVRGLARALPNLMSAPPPAAPTPPRERQVQHRLTPEQVVELVQQYEAGDDMQVLAKRWGLHRTTVAGHLRRSGVVLRRQGLSDEQLGEAKRLYGEGWSLQRLAERFGCNNETVRQVLKRAGIKPRKPWERS